MENINFKLNQLYYSTIRNIDVHLISKKVSLDLCLTENGRTEAHTLQFVGCSSLLWVEKMDQSSTFDFTACNYYELTSVQLMKTATTSSHNWLKQYSMEYNVAVEIWEAVLLLNAKEVLVDNQRFSIPK